MATASSVTTTPFRPTYEPRVKRAPSEALNPTQLAKPAYVLSVPLCYSTAVANNAWMEDLSDEERQPDFKKALHQFLNVYHFIASEALVYLLPSPGDCELQDLVFTANVGCVLEHLPKRDTVVVSNFTSEPRVREADVGAAFFDSLGYRVMQPPYKFEGEAELKHLHDNVYVGGYGIRSERAAFEWMEEQFDMTVIKLEETEPYLYHLDCTIFPLTREETLVCTEMYTEDEVAELEKHTNIIDVSVDDCFAGVCNSVRLSNTIMNSSHINELKAGTKEYTDELNKNRRLQDIAVEHGFEVNFFNLTEYMKGGALLSCMVMHLNRYSYEFALL
jgi:N-dimethylarginine dimethylaminohydrolase